MSTLFLVLVSILPTVLLAFKTNWDQKARDFILDMHNDMRRGEGGCQMNKLEYGMELERQAKRWAERCVFEHELIEDRGENLAWNSAENDELALTENAMQSWFDEKNMYSYGQYSCSFSCHYTQLVWDVTSKVGCHSLRCPNLVGAYRNAWYLVCFYTPKGNWNGEKPYEKSCSSQCLKGQTEEDGLCVGEPEKAGEDTEAEGAADENGDVNKECKDNHWRCHEWASMYGQCTANPSYMKRHCRKACGLCPSAGGCMDENPGCKGWAGRGECWRNPSYMHKYCQKSCEKC